jgi:hypothetical protein
VQNGISSSVLGWISGTLPIYREERADMHVYLLQVDEAESIEIVLDQIFEEGDLLVDLECSLHGQVHR